MALWVRRDRNTGSLHNWIHMSKFLLIKMGLIDLRLRCIDNAKVVVRVGKEMVQNKLKYKIWRYNLDVIKAYEEKLGRFC